MLELKHTGRGVCMTTLTIAALLITTLLYLSNVQTLTSTPFPSWPSDSKTSHYDGNTMQQHGAASFSYGGKHQQPPLDGLTLTGIIPHKYCPTVKNKRRLIVIGDIHGMNNELGNLLDLAKYDATRDHVVTLGDMVNKGPDSRGVLARLMSMDASAVRGNHEDHLLTVIQKYHNRKAVDSINEDEPSLDTESRRRKDKELLKVALTLTQRQIQWLSNLPVILKANPLPIYFVHGGLVPGIKLTKQDPWAVMNMRSLKYPTGEELRKRDDQYPISETASPADYSDDDSEQDDPDHSIQANKVIAIPVDDHSGEKWAKAWNRFQKALKKKYRKTVMYGHDSKRGFTEGKYTVGLDSGCVRGGHLTGLIIEARKSNDFTYARIQVPCKAPS